MIDLENNIYTYLAENLREEYPGIDVKAEYVDMPAKFPHVSIVEADNRILTRMRTNNVENAVSVMYEINVYSNKAGNKKSEAKAITNTLDDLLGEIGFTRTFREQIPNLRDATIYRIVCRYEAVIDRNNTIYQSE